MLDKLASLIEEQIDEFAALEALDVGMFWCFLLWNIFDRYRVPLGKMWVHAKYMDMTMVVSCLRYYAGWADKIQGKIIEVGASAWAKATFSPVIDWWE